MGNRLELGTFTVESGLIEISDPCYDKNVWCRVGGLPALNGEWAAEVEYSDEGTWGIRVAALRASHTSYSSHRPSSLKIIPGEVGVDSGQAGVFDTKFYKDDSLVTSELLNKSWKGGRYSPICEEDPWYSLCCAMTLGKKSAGVIPHGCVSSSGYGDGGYAAYGAYDENERLISVEIVFIGDEDDESYEDDWDDEEEEC